MTEYLIETTDKAFKIEIPDDWKVTYGPVMPGTQTRVRARNANQRLNAGINVQGGLTLRIYETDTKQRMIFHDVISFRDLSIPVMERIERADFDEDAESWSGQIQERYEWVSLDE
jgi:hypothetical protein